MYNDPANLFVADFMGNPTMNFVDGSAETENGKARIRIPGILSGTLNAPVPEGFRGGDAVLGIRPEHIEIRDDGACSGMVYSTLPSGMETTVKIDAGGTLITAVVFGDVDFPADSPIRFDIRRNIILFDRESGRNIVKGDLIM